MRVLAFAVAFLVGTACHRDIKSASALAVVTASDTVTEKVTTAPTERVTEKWHFSVTPGIGRALPIGDVASRPLVQREGASFPLSPGLGYAMDEYERVTEHLEPVETEKTAKTDKTNATLATATERETDVGFSGKFYLLVGGLLAAVVALGVFLTRSKLVRRLLGVPL